MSIHITSQMISGRGERITHHHPSLGARSIKLGAIPIIEPVTKIAIPDKMPHPQASSILVHRAPFPS